MTSTIIFLAFIYFLNLVAHAEDIRNCRLVFEGVVNVQMVRVVPRDDSSFQEWCEVDEENRVHCDRPRFLNEGKYSVIRFDPYNSGNPEGLVIGYCFSDLLNYVDGCPTTPYWYRPNRLTLRTQDYGSQYNFSELPFHTAEECRLHFVGDVNVQMVPVVFLNSPDDLTHTDLLKWCEVDEENKVHCDRKYFVTREDTSMLYIMEDTLFGSTPTGKLSIVDGCPTTPFLVTLESENGSVTLIPNNNALAVHTPEDCVLVFEGEFNFQMVPVAVAPSPEYPDDILMWWCAVDAGNNADCSLKYFVIRRTYTYLFINEAPKSIIGYTKRTELDIIDGCPISPFNVTLLPFNKILNVHATRNTDAQ